MLVEFYVMSCDRRLYCRIVKARDCLRFKTGFICSSDVRINPQIWRDGGLCLSSSNALTVDRIHIYVYMLQSICEISHFIKWLKILAIS